MKKLVISLGAAFLLLTFNPVQLKATAVPIPVSANATHPAESTNKLLDRLDEINAMDLSTLSKSERKALRKEVRAMKAMDGRGGVYISVGGLIIIILLLIILL